MLAFPSMLVPAAEKAGMAVPPEPNSFSKHDFPHFAVFCALQLGRRMNDFTEHWDNARIIAAIPVDQLKTMYLEDFINAGVSYAAN